MVESKGPRKPSEWIGYKLMTGYLLQLISDNGTFPALLEEEPFICVSRGLLGQVRDLLPENNSEIVGVMIYANLDKALCFIVGHRTEIKPIQILLRRELVIFDVDDFEWSQEETFLRS
ncbi:MAG: hypothetical protein KAS02_00235 [Candidatus Pacebacteria bacterium]|nr:hypothetical protein [Candidatus Paceibacterota bacterium]